MKFELLAVPVIYLAFAAVEALRTGFARKPGQFGGDGIVEAVSTVSVVGLIQPAVIPGRVGCHATDSSGRRQCVAGLAGNLSSGNAARVR